MTLNQVNDLWELYKERYEVDSDAMITDVCYDTPENVEGSFDLFELLGGIYILHLNPRFHLYSEDYVRFVLFHEFTHFADFIKATAGDQFEERQDLFLYMNSYSEYHACRVALGQSIDTLSHDYVYIDKIQIPGPFREISIRRLLAENLFRTKYAYIQFFRYFKPSDFVSSFRQLMYLFGYIALFKQTNEQMAQHVLKVIGMDSSSCYMDLFQALKDKDTENILKYTKNAYNDAFLMYLRNFIRTHYDESLYDDEDVDNLSMDNYQEFLEDLDARQDELDEAREQMESPVAAFIAGVLATCSSKEWQSIDTSFIPEE